MSELGSQLPPAGPLAFRYLSTNSDFPDVTLACEYGLQLQAHQLILAPPSPFKMGSRTCVNFLQASLGEFLSVWRMGGTATLHLNTSGGTVEVGYNLRLGHPDSPFPLPPPPSPPPPPPHRPRHKGPAKRERDRQRAARHQAGRPAPAPPPPGAPSSPPPPSNPAAPVDPPSPHPSTPATTAPPAPPAPPAPGGAGRKKITNLPPAPQDWSSSWNWSVIPQLDGVIDTSSSSATSTTPPPSPGTLPEPPPCKKCGNINTSWASKTSCQPASQPGWGMDPDPPCAVDLATHPRLGCTLRTCSAHWPPPIK